MEPNLLHPNSSLLFPLILILITSLIYFPASFCQQTQPYDACGQSIQCGSINDNVSYPFSGSNRPAYCGYPGFELTCQSGVLLLEYQDLRYRILDVDSPTRTIAVARNDLWSTSCPQYLYNTTFNSTLFNGNNFGQEDVSLYYGCQSPTGPLSGGINQFPCDVNNTQTTSYFIQTRIINSSRNFLVQCNNNIMVPVNQTWAQRFVSTTDPSATAADLRSALTAGFRLQWTANDTECNECVRSGGQCGSGSTNPSLFTCYCVSGNFSLTCDNINPGFPGSNGAGQYLRSKLLIGISSGVAGIVLLFVVILCGRKRLSTNIIVPKKTGKINKHDIEMFLNNHGPLTPKWYSYADVKKMTNSFAHKLGKGGYGSVFKGRLPDGRLVAVKLLSEANEDGQDFLNEVASISRTSHVNIVTLVGFCFQGKRRALVYDFMPNGSLDRFICDDRSSSTNFHLDWNTLYQIAIGIARGLEYLHRGCNTRIVHFDIKPHNILLDQDFCPKIADFGLAKLCKRKESVVSMLGVRGTAGYIAPEIFFRKFGGPSHKSDVYSYGMMVLEMTGARENNNVRATGESEAYFPDWIYSQIEHGESLEDYGVTTEEEEAAARKMMLVSLWCIQSNPSDRPSMSKVVEMLEGSLQSLQVPPKHFLSSTTGPPQDASPSFLQSSDLNISSSNHLREASL